MTGVMRHGPSDGSGLIVEPAEDPILTETPVLIVAVVLALARNVFSAMGLPIDGLRMEIAQPRSQVVDGAFG